MSSPNPNKQDNEEKQQSAVIISPASSRKWEEILTQTRSNEERPPPPSYYEALREQAQHGRQLSDPISYSSYEDFLPGGREVTDNSAEDESAQAGGSEQGEEVANLNGDVMVGGDDIVAQFDIDDFFLPDLLSPTGSEDIHIPRTPYVQTTPNVEAAQRAAVEAQKIANQIASKPMTLEDSQNLVRLSKRRRFE